MAKWSDRFRRLVGGERGADPTPQRPPAPTESGGAEVATTQVAVPTGLVAGHLTVVEGPPELMGLRFRLHEPETRIGRGEDSHVRFDQRSISRVHAALVREGAGFALHHRSQTNATYVNGVCVSESQPLADGDEIRLADEVVLRLSFSDSSRPRVEPRAVSLRRAMEERVELDRRIEADFVRDGSFLDVDVVDSYGMKADEPQAERIVASFERFRAYVAQRVEAQGGQVLNSNGDEVMAFFERADSAVASARDILRSLAGFNDAENLLRRPFRIRTGIHTGRSAVDLVNGVAYSPVLDGAGHLQKAAPVGGLLISEETIRALSRPIATEKAEAVTKTGIAGYLVGVEP
jgi:pSer/pThr/pTyr-binding forkhead associated (FHA) protein